MADLPPADVGDELGGAGHDVGRGRGGVGRGRGGGGGGHALGAAGHGAGRGAGRGALLPPGGGHNPNRVHCVRCIKACEKRYCPCKQDGLVCDLECLCVYYSGRACENGRPI